MKSLSTDSSPEEHCSGRQIWTGVLAHPQQAGRHPQASHFTSQGLSFFIRKTRLNSMLQSQTDEGATASSSLFSQCLSPQLWNVGDKSSISLGCFKDLKEIMCSVSMLIHKKHPINSRCADFQFHDAVTHATQHAAAWQGVTWNNRLCPAGRRPVDT